MNILTLLQVRKFYKMLENNKIINVKVNSSNLHSWMYNPKSKRLSVLFNKGIFYEYFNVDMVIPLTLLDLQREGKSIGQYFNKNIMNKYTYNRMAM